MTGAVVLVGPDVALLHLDVQLLQAEAVGDPLAADRDQQALTLDRLGLLAALDRDRHLAVDPLEGIRLDLGAGQHLMPRLVRTFASCCPTSASSSGKRVGKNSTRVTSAP